MKLFQETKSALGTAAILTLVLPDRDDSFRKLFAELWQKVSDFEQKFSRFLPESELSRFNQGAGKKFAIDNDFRQLLLGAKEMSKKTGGIFNPFILPNLQRAGYLGSFPTFVADNALDFRRRKIHPSDDLKIGRSWAKIPADAAIDFGGIGKGYLLDLLAEYLEKNNIQNYWLSLGGDVICSGVDADGKPWEIAIAAADSPNDDVEKISNRGQKLAVATSGILRRRGKNWHHIINPKTGRPAESDILVASVVADSAVTADIAAKCAVIVGSKNLEQIAKMLPLKMIISQLKNQIIKKIY